MKIGNIKIRLIKKEDSKLKAVASIIIEDHFVVHDIKIIDGVDGLFIAMPSRKTPEGEFKDIAHPLDSETRQLFSTTIIEEYHKKLQEIE